jgi:hypothetical protein
MKKTIIKAALVVGALSLLTGNAWATSYGDNITIYDGTQDTTHTGVNIGAEDQETEPGMTNSQVWDLEGFFQDGNNLSMVGGYNFDLGVGDYKSGDIFFSTDALFGSSQAPAGYAPSNGWNDVESNFGYEYVIDLDFLNKTYDVLSLGSTGVTTTTAYYELNEEDLPGSNPWRYVSGGVSVASGSFNFFDGLSDTDTGFLGGNHYALTGFDLSFLGADQEFYSHFTMGCGNDNLMGHSTAPVPEPATMLLFGTGIAGLLGVRRKKKK